MKCLEDRQSTLTWFFHKSVLVHTQTWHKPPQRSHALQHQIRLYIHLLSLVKMDTTPGLRHLFHCQVSWSILVMSVDSFCTMRAAAMQLLMLWSQPFKLALSLLLLTSFMLLAIFLYLACDKTMAFGPKQLVTSHAANKCDTVVVEHCKIPPYA